MEGSMVDNVVPLPPRPVSALLRDLAKLQGDGGPTTVLDLDQLIGPVAELGELRLGPADAKRLLHALAAIYETIEAVMRDPPPPPPHAA
jgi:hypothetical protein